MSKLSILKSKSKEVFKKNNIEPVEIHLRFLGLKTDGLKAGVTKFREGKRPIIYLDILYFLSFPYKMIEQTLLHEVAHVVDWYKFPENRSVGHGSSWCIIAADLGVEPKPITVIKRFSKNYLRLQSIKFIYKLLQKKI